jgi:cytochrome c-type biogenesis protein
VVSTSAGKLLADFNHIGGIIIIAFGVFMLLSSKISKLNFEKKIIPSRAKTSYPLSFVFGLAFATGWTPCIGPILGSILTLAATSPGHAFVLLLSYSMGLGIPFILMGVFFSRFTRFIKSMSKHLKYYSVIMGSFIILLGVLVYTNQLAAIASFPLLNNILLGR